MDRIDHISLLGQYYGEGTLAAALECWGLKQHPRIPRDELKTSIALPEMGIELTFTDERALDVQFRSYPDGALVLTNIFFHAMKTDQHGAYEGDLPLNLSFSFDKTELISCLGEPDIVGLEGTLMRFDRPQYFVSVQTDDSGHIAIVGVQAARKATLKGTVS